jgi:hypothetical protein
VFREFRDCAMEREGRRGNEWRAVFNIVRVQAAFTGAEKRKI